MTQTKDLERNALFSKVFANEGSFFSGKRVATSLVAHGIPPYVVIDYVQRHDDLDIPQLTRGRVDLRGHIVSPQMSVRNKMVRRIDVITPPHYQYPLVHSGWQPAIFDVPLTSSAHIDRRRNLATPLSQRELVPPDSFRLSRIAVRTLCESQRASQVATISAAASGAVPFDVPEDGIEQVSLAVVGALTGYARRVQALHAHKPAVWPSRLLLTDSRETKLVSFRSDLADYLQDRLDLGANAVSDCLTALLHELADYLSTRTFDASWGTIAREQDGLVLVLKEQSFATTVKKSARRELVAVRAL